MADTDASVSVLGLLLDERICVAPEVQNVLSRYGGLIVLRAGTPSTDRCSGTIVLALSGPCAQIDQMVCELKAIPGVRAGLARIT